MKDTEKMLIKSLKKHALEAKRIKPKWKEGDNVRVLKSLYCNVNEVSEYLGSVCKVEEVIINVPIFSSPQVEYMLRLGKRLEPFFEYELDSRYKSHN